MTLQFSCQKYNFMDVSYIRRFILLFLNHIYLENFNNDYACNLFIFLTKQYFNFF